MPEIASSAMLLGLIWRALGDDQYSSIVRLLMLSAQRLNEIASLRRDEIDFDRGVISLPASRTKNHRPHEIPLTPVMSALLQARGPSEWVFGRRKGPFSGLSGAKRRLYPIPD